MHTFKKILKIISLVLISVVVSFVIALPFFVDTITSGDERVDVGGFTMRFGYGGYGYNGFASFPLYENRYALINFEEDYLTLPREEPLPDQKELGLAAYEAWVYFDFSKKITSAVNTFAEPEEPALDERCAEALLSYIGEEAENIHAFSFQLDDEVHYAAVNYYSRSNGKDGDRLYKQDIERGVTYEISKDYSSVVETGSYEGCVVLANGGTSVLYEKGDGFYIYSTETGEERFLFEDTTKDIVFQHNNNVEVLYNGSYVLFKRIRRKLTVNEVTYTLVSMDAETVMDLFTRRTTEEA